MKILYFDTKATKDKVGTYSYYNGSYIGLCEIAEVDIIRNPISDIQQVWNKNYDAVIFGLGWFSNSNPVFFKKIKGLDTIDVPVICNLHKPSNEIDLKINFIKINKIRDVMMSAGFIEKFKLLYQDIQFHLLPFAAHKDIFYPATEKIIDLGFSGALHNIDNGQKIKNGFTKEKSEIRGKITDIVKSKMAHYNIFWNIGTHNVIIPEIEYSEKVRSSKIWFSTDGPSEEVSPRYYEVILSKTLLMCNTIPEAYKHIFIDKVNCVVFSDDLHDLEDLINHYLTNNEDRNTIIENAYNDFTKNHTWKNRSEYIKNLIIERSCT